MKHYIIALCMLSALAGYAQEKDRNVTVERDYKPVIQDAGIITSVPTVTEPVVQKSEAKYTDVNFPLSVGQSVQTLSAADLDLEKRLNPAAAFIRIGAGNYLNNMLDFYFPMLKTDKTQLDLKIDHLASFGKKAHSKSNASVRLNSFLGDVELMAGLHAGYEYLKYYGSTYNAFGEVVGFDTLKTNIADVYESKYQVNDDEVNQLKTLDEIGSMPTTSGMWRFGTFVGLRSVPQNSDFSYNAVVNYSGFSSKNGLAEHVIHTKAGFSKQADANRWGVDLDLRNMFYNSNIGLPSSLVPKSYTVLGINPYYSIERDRFTARIGVKTAFSFVQGSVFSPSPDIFVEWKIKPTSMALYAGLSGGYQINTLDKTVNENPYLAPELRLEDTYTPIYAYTGVKVKPVYNLLIDAFVSYRQINNQFFYSNQSFEAIHPNLLNLSESTLFTNRFNVEYSKASLTNLGLRANYNIRNAVNIQLKTVYNAWKTYDIDQAWQMPKFETDLTSEVRISRSLMANASIFIKSNSNAHLGSRVEEMPSVFDANLGLSYTYLNSLSFFGRLNNIFNNQYQQFLGYQVQGFNLMLGASYSF